MIGLYDTSWFLNFDFFGTNMRELFQIRTVNLSVAVWVGFLALFGIATDDGVLVATFLQSSFKRNKPTSIPAIRNAVVEGGLRRVRASDDDYCNHHFGINPGTNFNWQGSRYYVTYGHSFFWWHEPSSYYDVYSAGTLFAMARMELGKLNNFFNEQIAMNNQY